MQLSTARLKYCRIVLQHRNLPTHCLDSTELEEFSPYLLLLVLQFEKMPMSMWNDKIYNFESLTIRECSARHVRKIEKFSHPPNESRVESSAIHFMNYVLAV